MTQKENGQAEQAPLSTPEEARRLLAEDRARRLQLCQAEIRQVLQRHGFQAIVAVPTITDDGRLTARIQYREA